MIIVQCDRGQIHMASILLDWVNEYGNKIQYNLGFGVFET